MTDAIARFIADLRSAVPGIEATVDAPDDADGESFIDIHDGLFATQVSYKPRVGFGVYVGSETFGRKPDELFATVPKAVERIVQLRDVFEKQGAVRPLDLRQLRELAGFTQVEVARALSIKQPTVQRIEARQTLQLDTLVRHVRAMGGSLEMRVVFPDMEARLELPPAKQAG